MSNKYLKPAIKVVSVNVERGYAVSGDNGVEVNGFKPKDASGQNKNSIWG